MAVTVTKTKQVKPKALEPVEAVASSVDLTQMDDGELADKYGSMNDQIEALMSNPVFAQFELVRDELQRRLNQFEHDDEVKLKGKHWLVSAGTCSKSPRKVIDNATALKFMGTETFLKVAKLSVGDAEKYLQPDQVSKVVSPESYTKNRKISVAFLG